MFSKTFRWEWYILAVCCAFALLAQFVPPALKSVSGNGNGVFVPIIMYHSLLKNPASANSYTVSPSTFEADLQYLLDNGYQTVFIQDLIDYVYQGQPLPPKPVVITFDDGHLNTLTYGLPILQKHGAKAVLSAVGGYVEEAVAQNDPNPQYAYCTWDDLKTLRDSGCFEIQNHSYRLHSSKGARGAARKEGEVVASYHQRLISDVLKMQQALAKEAEAQPTAFTYPFGFTDPEGERVLRELGFLATLTCAERPNYLTDNPECLYLLGRYNRPSGISTASFMQKALRH